MSHGPQVVPRHRLIAKAAEVVAVLAPPLQLLVEEFSRWVLSRGSFGFSKKGKKHHGPWWLGFHVGCYWLRSVTFAFAVLGSFVVGCSCWRI